MILINKKWQGRTISAPACCNSAAAGGAGAAAAAAARAGQGLLAADCEAAAGAAAAAAGLDEIHFHRAAGLGQALVDQEADPVLVHVQVAVFGLIQRQAQAGAGAAAGHQRDADSGGDVVLAQVVLDVFDSRIGDFKHGLLLWKCGPPEARPEISLQSVYPKPFPLGNLIVPPLPGGGSTTWSCRHDMRARRRPALPAAKKS
jgi:hypothetical protein